MSDIFQILIDCWKWDIWFYSQPWVYYCLLIPAIMYIPFMLAKWALLTCPVWLPLSMIFGSFKISRKK